MWDGYTHIFYAYILYNYIVILEKLTKHSLWDRCLIPTLKDKLHWPCQVQCIWKGGSCDEADLSLLINRSTSSLDSKMTPTLAQQHILQPKALPFNLANSRHQQPHLAVRFQHNLLIYSCCFVAEYMIHDGRTASTNRVGSTISSQMLYGCWPVPKHNHPRR